VEPKSVPVFPKPEESRAVVPEPSSNFQYPTRPVLFGASMIAEACAMPTNTRTLIPMHRDTMCSTRRSFENCISIEFPAHNDGAQKVGTGSEFDELVKEVPRGQPDIAVA